MSHSINFSQFSPFNLISGQLLSELALHTDVVTVSKGEMLFKRSKEYAKSFYLMEGEVDLIDNAYGVENVVAGTERARCSLNLESPSSVSAIAKSTATYFEVNTKAIERMVSSNSSQMDVKGQMMSDVQESSDWMSDLLQCPVFSRIPSRHLQNLFKQFEKVYAQNGEVIIKEGEPGDYFYVLSAGTAEITNNSGSVSLSVSAGAYFGEEALISDAPRNASIRMTGNGILQRLSAEDFTSLIKKPVLKYVNPEYLSSISNEYQVIDVRMPVEYRMAHFPGSINVPLSKLRKRLDSLGPDHTYLVSDEAGVRTDLAAYILCQAGFDACILSGAAPDERLSHAH